jgi:hypothetical protein
MTQYYVRTTGNDAAGGTTPATAWQTIGKALGATGMSSGDTVYVGSGVYRELITVEMVNPTAETFVVGDVFGNYTGDEPGEIRITNYLTNDTTLPTDSDLLTINARDYLTFSNLVFHATILSTTNLALIQMIVGSQNINFRDCSFFMNEISGNSSCWCIRATLTADVDSNFSIDRCIFYTTGISNAMLIVASGSATAHYDSGLEIKNCVFIGDTVGATINVGSTGFAFFGGGMVVRNCSLFYSGTGITASNIPTSIPVLAYNNMIMHAGFSPALQSSGANMMTEDYNLIYSFTPRHANVSAGVHSISDGSYAPLFHTGQETQYGATIRPFGMPTADSPWNAFGNDASAPTVDFLNRPRPSGLNGDETQNAVGAYELHDTARAETTIYDSAPACQAIDGPGDHDFEIPVNAEETTITIKVLYNIAHGTTNKPQVQILANPAIGVTGETVTSDGMPDGWAELAFAAFTPTGRGEVILRCISRSESASGIAYFDTITVNGA